MSSNTNRAEGQDISIPPERQIGDYAHSITKAVIAAVPLVGGSASEIFSLIITAPIEKRRDEWIQYVVEGLHVLEQHFESFKIEQAATSEVFITTLLSATRAAILTHQHEKRETLRNAILNSALPNAPDETRQQMFIRWIDELSPWHLKILEIFEKECGVPSINLDNPEWVMNIALDQLANLIEGEFPALQGNHGLYVQIIRELHTMGLIVNRNPAKGMLTSLYESPKLTPLAKEFMKFIRSPIDEN